MTEQTWRHRDALLSPCPCDSAHSVGQERAGVCDTARVTLEFDIIAAEFIRALRGRRSQVALSRRLGFNTNVLHSWERRKRSPSTGRLFELAERVGVDVPEAIGVFLRRKPPWLAAFQPRSGDSVRAFLLELVGAMPVTELARQTGFSRFRLARWLSGTAQPRTPQLLALVHHGTQRLPDFIGAFTDAAALPSLRPEVGRLAAARMVATQRPWSQLVLRFLETVEYRTLAAHEPGWIAERAGISMQEEEATLGTLLAAGQVRRGETHYHPQALEALDMRHDRRTVHQQRTFWARVAAERSPDLADGLCAYNICAISDEGYHQLKALQREYLLKARALIAASHPEERVVLLQVNLLPFGT